LSRRFKKKKKLAAEMLGGAASSATGGAAAAAPRPMRARSWPAVKQQKKETISTTLSHKWAWLKSQRSLFPPSNPSSIIHLAREQDLGLELGDSGRCLLQGRVDDKVGAKQLQRVVDHNLRVDRKRLHLGEQVSVAKIKKKKGK
jgi:hypothetical protein